MDTAHPNLVLSIVIPTYNEAAVIGKLLQYLLQHTSRSAEVIVADGGSSDATQAIAVKLGVRVLPCKRKGRGTQMNQGAAAATGNVLYFLHADTFPPTDFERQILEVVQQGYGSGSYRLRFDFPHWFLQLNAWFTRFDVDAIRFGDQSLFVRRAIFESVNGFNEQLLLLEDQEIVKRLRKFARFRVMPYYVTTSARKYQQHGVYKIQGGYFLIYGLYKLGVAQQRLVQVYKWLLRK
ncbi:TIGR04283 family arsenosugar biosynthesis glycosyltransferase [Pontibacter silvestris]|uniref:TIGR04283 family arsenosugar biosynthesis glycosyltransferase n=1 Tax=Pontibacter silvestris TaxID=2305183 RepID=A0ABW4WRB9_9BACT|nr:TIGR04283 family arsenosugar biosynthesis glycosyltransferase [Pontibacter silvestris]MCC9138184.1 TIGR04283 family arsenosugar biosynthesis glycosyltransferase [Pontibacter silvestris]